MNQFSASDAALEGFRLTRERAGTILAWSVVNLLAILVLGGVMLLSLGKPFIDYLKGGGLTSGDAEGLAELLAKSWPAFLLVMLLVVLFLSILTAGIYRIVLRPGERGFAHLRLGPDEFRLTAVNLLLFAIGMTMLIVADLIVTSITAAAGVVAGLLTAVLAAIPMTWIGVRLSLATPMTFAVHRISIRASWELTRGRFWPLFWMILLTVIFYLMIWILVAVIVSSLVAIAGGPVNLLEYRDLSPLIILIGVIIFLAQMVLPVLQWVIIYAPFAVAYKQLQGDAPATGLGLRAQGG